MNLDLEPFTHTVDALMHVDLMAAAALASMAAIAAMTTVVVVDKRYKGHGNISNDGATGNPNRGGLAVLEL